MIFFSDPVSEVNLQEEIRGALESRLCFYAYRMPGDMMVSFGSSEGTIEGLGEPGFVIAPFLPEGSIITIPYKNCKKAPAESVYQFPSYSTTKEEYEEEIKVIKRFIDDSCEKKVVAARVKVENKRIDVGATFLSLSKAYPAAFTFCFSTPQTGCWIGASPEMLLRRHGSTLETMALAGTRPAGTPEEWDGKNRLEQQMVTDFIKKCFTENGLNVEAGDATTRRAGNIEHLCTPIISELSNNADFTDTKVKELISSLSPTPALAGVPKQEAIEIITGTEKFQRGYYGGFCGPLRSLSEFTFFVTLRCGRIEGNRIALFAGGGITKDSEEENEWNETNLKLATLEGFCQKEE